MCKVSVVIPNYNHEQFLKQRIESVLNQSFRDYEVILLDDCSTDNSRSIIESYRSHSKVSHIIYNHNNSGSTFKQWKKGIEYAKGEYIWIAESDDFAAPEFLEAMISIIDNNPALGIAYCQSFKVDKSGTILGDMRYWTDDLDRERWRHDYTNNGIVECNDYLLFKNTIPNASAVIFRKSYYAPSHQQTKMKQCGDWYLWVSILTKSDIYFHSKPLNYFRTHASTTRNLNDVHKQLIRIKEEYLTVHLFRHNDSAPRKQRLVELGYKVINLMMNNRTVYVAYKGLILLFKYNPGFLPLFITRSIRNKVLIDASKSK